MPRLRPWGEASDEDEGSYIGEQMAPDPDAEGRLYELATHGAGELQPTSPEVRVVTLRARTEGLRGKATGTARTSEAVHGRILSVHLRYHPQAPTSTDVRLRTLPEGHHSVEVLVVPESRTDGYFAPDAEPVWRPMPRTYSYVPFEVHAPLELVVTECDALSPAVTATIVIEEDSGESP